MKKNDTYGSRRMVMPSLKKGFLQIKLTFFCLFLGLAQLFANSNISQSPELTLNLENTQFEEFILENGAESSMQQPGTVSGKVTDSSGAALPGATIVIKGTTNGAVTDSDGNFSIPRVPANGTLIFSFIGMKNQEVAVAGKSTIKIVMASESIDLEEVVAVGYGTQKRATLTGSVASVRNEELIVTKNENVLNMLTGKLPGVRVVQKSSSPGDYNTVIDIRGMGTPLFVVDGITRDQGYFARMDPQ